MDLWDGRVECVVMEMVVFINFCFIHILILLFLGKDCSSRETSEARRREAGECRSTTL